MADYAWSYRIVIDYRCSIGLGLACDPLYTRSMNSIFGRTGRRILFGLLGSIMVLVSVLRLKNKKK